MSPFLFQAAYYYFISRHDLHGDLSSDEEKFLWVEAISAVLGVANSRGLGGVETAPITDFDSHEIAQRLGSPTWDSGNFIKDDDANEWDGADFESGGSGRKRTY